MTGILTDPSWLIRKSFIRHSGGLADFKVECDNLTDEEIETFAFLIKDKFKNIGKVIPVPRGGLRIASALEKFSVPATGRTFIVDDVATTGNSMTEYREGFGDIGVVLFWIGGKECPAWIRPVFTLWA